MGALHLGRQDDYTAPLGCQDIIAVLVIDPPAGEDHGAAGEGHPGGAFHHQQLGRHPGGLAHDDEGRGWNGGVAHGRALGG
jgi:hypothetical protein